MRRDKAIIGARLREARETAMISKEDAAESANVQVSAITAWERGTAMPNLVQVRGLLACYGLSGFKLLFGANPVELSKEEALELASAKFSPSLRMKMDVVIALTRRAANDPVSRRVSQQ